jgi:transketolase
LAVRDFLAGPHEPFVLPDDVKQAWDARSRGQADEAAWSRSLSQYRAEHAALAAEFERRVRGELPPDFATSCEAALQRWNARAATMASRKASQEAIEEMAKLVPELVGGSADLAPSNPWGGRSNAPAGGADRDAAIDPEHGRLAAVRQRGDPGRLAKRA